MRKDVRQGYRNFLYSEEDFILHYSAYTFLCNERFQYHITDISKGAMLTRDAGKLREERYERWLPLLQDELRALGHPKIIAVGSTVQDFLTGIGLKFSGTVLHYSWNNSRWIQERYSEIASDVSTEEFNGIENKLQHFAYVTMGHVGYSEEMKKRLLPKLFKRPLPKWKKALLAVYKYDFQRID